MAGTITEYSSGLTASAAPRSGVLGPDGNVWFTEFSQNKVCKITSGGTITEYSVPTGTGPWDICSDGTNLWFTCVTNQKLVKCTTGGSMTEYSIGTAGPRGICYHSDGKLYIACDAGNAILQCNTSGTTLNTWTSGITSSARPRSICSDGTNLWFTEFATATTSIGKITTSGTVTEYTTGLTSGCQPTDLCYGEDGNVWITTFVGDKVAKVTSGGTITEYTITGMDGPGSIRAFRGSLWVANQNADNFTRLDYDGSTYTNYSSGLTTPASPRCVAPGNDDRVWFGCATSNKLGAITGPLLETFTSDGIIAARNTKTFTADGIIAARATATHTLDVKVVAAASGTPSAPGTPAVSGTFDGYRLGSDEYGRIFLGVTTSGDVTHLTIERSADGGSTWADVSSNCWQIGTASGILVLDHRPAYGSQPVDWYGTTAAKYRATAKNPSGSSSASSASSSVYSQVDADAVSLQQADTLHTQLQDASFFAAACDEPHMGYYIRACAWAFYTFGDTKWLDDCTALWTDHIDRFDALNLWRGRDINAVGTFATQFQVDYHGRFIGDAIMAARMLRATGNATAEALAADIIDQCNLSMKAFIDYMPTGSLTTDSWQVPNFTNAPVETAYTSGLDGIGYIYKDTAATPRAWMVQTAGYTGALSGSTTHVADLLALEATSEGATAFGVARWQANHTYDLNDRVRNSDGTKVFKVTAVTWTGGAAEHGKSGASEPTWPGSGTVTDGTISIDNLTGQITWTYLGAAATFYQLESTYVPPINTPAWASTTAYTAGQMVKGGTRIWRCTTAGTSGGSAPTWTDSNHATVTDGTVTWTEITRTGTAVLPDGTTYPTPPFSSSTGTFTGVASSHRIDFMSCYVFALMECADFQSGSYKTTAQTRVLAEMATVTPLQAYDGATAQGIPPGYPYWDTAYAGFQGRLAAVIVTQLGSSFDPEFTLYASKLASYLNTSWVTEPNVSNHPNPVTGDIPAEGTDLSTSNTIIPFAPASELAWRKSTTQLIGDGTHDLMFTNAFVNANSKLPQTYKNFLSYTQAVPYDPNDWLYRQQGHRFLLETPDFSRWSLEPYSTILGSSLITYYLTFTADAIVAARLTNTFTADAVIAERFTKDLTADAVVSARLTNTFTADALLRERNTATLTTDGIVLGTKAFTADGIAAARTTATVTADGVVFAAGTQTFTADAVLVARPTISLTVDAVITLVSAVTTKTYTADGIIWGRATATFTADGYILAAAFATFTADGVVFDPSPPVTTQTGSWPSLEHYPRTAVALEHYPRTQVELTHEPGR